DLEHLLDQLDFRSVVVVGISVGGMIALDLAARLPERVAALVLCDTGTKLGTFENWNARIQAIHQYGLVEIASTVIERWFAPSFAARNPDTYRGYYNMLSRTPEAGYLGTCAAIRDADLTDSARTVTQPSLILFGAADLSTPP